jgi:hypothetical protein
MREALCSDLQDPIGRSGLTPQYIFTTLVRGSVLKDNKLLLRGLCCIYYNLDLSNVQASRSSQEQSAPRTQVVDTFDMSHTAAELRPPPGRNASLEERMVFLNQQLDSVGLERAILSGLLLLGSGRTERLQGGVVFCMQLRPMELGRCKTAYSVLD